MINFLKNANLVAISKLDVPEDARPFDSSGTHYIMEKVGFVKSPSLLRKKKSQCRNERQGQINTRYLGADTV